MAHTPEKSTSVVEILRALRETIETLSSVNSHVRSQINSLAGYTGYTADTDGSGETSSSVEAESLLSQLHSCVYGLREAVGNARENSLRLGDAIAGNEAPDSPCPAPLLRTGGVLGHPGILRTR